MVVPGQRPASGICESCGASGEAPSLRAVHRIYLQTDGEGRVVGEQVLSDVELWCLSCRSLYPNQEIGEPPR